MSAPILLDRWVMTAFPPWDSNGWRVPLPRIPRAVRVVLRKVVTGVRVEVRATVARWDWVHEARLRFRSRSATFADAYARSAWGSSESGSGTGSELRATVNIRDRLPVLLDAPCGDWNWMQHVELPADYFGADIVAEVIERNRRRFARPGVTFQTLNIVSDRLPNVDFVLCRDCWVHLSLQDIAAALENFRRTGAKYLLVNSASEVAKNKNQLTGHAWRHLNLRLAPFGFPAPLETFPDGGEVDPSELCLWPLQELPSLRL